MVLGEPVALGLAGDWSTVACGDGLALPVLGLAAACACLSPLEAFCGAPLAGDCFACGTKSGGRQRVWASSKRRCIFVLSASSRRTMIDRWAFGSAERGAGA